MISLRCGGPAEFAKCLFSHAQIACLGLQKDVRATDRRFPGPRQRRYVYYPDHLVDVTGPSVNRADMAWTVASFLSTARNLFTEPLFSGFLPSVGSYISQEVRRRHDRLESPVRGPDDPRAILPWPSTVGDESIGAFYARHMGGRRGLVDNMMSALTHGVYGGDVWKLSVQSSLFQRSWLNEQLPPPSAEGDATWMRTEDVTLMHDVLAANPFAGSELYELAMQSRHWGYIDFHGGFSVLTRALEAALRKNPKVTIRMGTKVTELTPRSEEGSRKIGVNSCLEQTPCTMSCTDR